MKTYYVYIMANGSRSTLYIGVTNDLARRVAEHNAHAIQGFSSKYNTTDLVYYEETSEVEAAISREKQLKGWSRAKKDRLIDSMNPTRKDLAAPNK